jgi:homoserine kinase type II
MAVYTQVGAEDVAALLLGYDVGELVAIKGIAEGVENSNFFIETTQSKFILTLYEKRVNPDDLPFFHAMLDHLHKGGCKVPRFITDRKGQWLQEVCGRPACLIEFLSGFSVSTPTATQAYATGEALGEMHRALQDFSPKRSNSLGIDAFRPLAERCGEDMLNKIAPELAARVMAECDFVEQHWPRQLPAAAIHADLFPDNVLMLDDGVSGLIDFYFACTDLRIYDLAVTHAAWSFSNDGVEYFPQVGDAIIAGYEKQFEISAEARNAFPIVARAACLRFLLTRCYDWINTPPTAIVTQKDPLAFLKRLDFYTVNSVITH